jgi:ribosomal protein S18 acetylase RimI-like enzyme
MPADSPDDEALRARRLLTQDRVWCAYALADSEPPYSARTRWHLGSASVVLVYRGLAPPWLFAHGDPEEVDRLMQEIPSGQYQYGLLATHRARLANRMRPARETNMWRMVLRPEAFPAGRSEGAELLGPGDLPGLRALFGDHPDRPDSFDPRQLEDGAFFGIRRAGELVSAAGTHVVGPSTRVAGVGNVFTHPAHRRRGYAASVSAAVVEALLGRSITTIVLNVPMVNEAALALYRGLGFWPFCGYYEGVGELSAVAP